MTLREQLDARVKKESAEALKEEIKELFLKADVRDLKRGLTIKIFYNSQKEIYYIINESGYTGKDFKRVYDKNMLKDVIPLMKKEGIEVTGDVDKGEVYMRYVPLK